MHVYFVRHGETDLNRARIHQSPQTPLNSRGVSGARTVAEYLRPMNPDLLVTSSYTRALETARIIGTRVGLAPIPDARFREVERPSVLAGRSHFSPRSLCYACLTILHRNDPLWRYRDAENFSDLYRRAREAYGYIDSHKDTHQSIIIVSHSEFIGLMVAYMCGKEHLTTWDVIKTSLRIGTLKNCGVIEMKRKDDPASCSCTWELVRQTEIGRR